MLASQELVTTFSSARELVTCAVKKPQTKYVQEVTLDPSHIELVIGY